MLACGQTRDETPFQNVRNVWDLATFSSPAQLKCVCTITGNLLIKLLIIIKEHYKGFVHYTR